MTWKGKSVEDLSDSHLKNAIRWAERKWWKSSMEDISEVEPEYSNLVEEATRRKMLSPDYEPVKHRLGI